MPRKINNST